MFKATLYIFEKEYPLLDLQHGFTQNQDRNGRPTTKPTDGAIHLQFASTSDDTGFYEAMFSPVLLVKGHIRVYKRDGLQKHYDIEFANATVSYLNEHFNASSPEALSMEVTLVPQIQRVRGTIFELPANPSNPFIPKAAPKQRDNEKELISYYLTDTEGNRIEVYETDQLIVLHIETKNMVGERFSASLKDHEHDFEHNGMLLQNDTIQDLTITSDVMQIELKVVTPQENTMAS